MIEIAKLLNSQDELRLNESFKIMVQYAQPPRGSSRKDIPKRIEDKLHKKRCVIRIDNADDICMARAIVLAKAISDHDSSTHPEVQKLRRGEKASKAAALELIQKSGLTPRKFTVNEDSPAFEKTLGPEYQVYVLSLDHQQTGLIIYPDAKEGQELKRPLILLLHNEHFDVCTSMTAILGVSYYCYKCRHSYSNRENHRCKAKCQRCLRTTCTKTSEAVVQHCDDCGSDFYPEDCYAYHATVQNRRMADNSQSLCARVKRYSKCCCTYSLFRRDINVNPHQCGETFCKHCGQHDIPEQHRCFMQPLKLSDKDHAQHQQAHFLYFDIETYVSENESLIANYAVSVL